MLTQVRGRSTLPDVETSLLHFTLESQASKRTACAGVRALKSLSAQAEQGGRCGARGVDVSRWLKQSQDRHTATGPWRCLARLYERDTSNQPKMPHHHSTERSVSSPGDWNAIASARSGRGLGGVAERRGMARRVWRWERRRSAGRVWRRGASSSPPPPPPPPSASYPCYPLHFCGHCSNQPDWLEQMIYIGSHSQANYSCPGGSRHQPKVTNGNCEATKHINNVMEIKCLAMCLDR